MVKAKRARKAETLKQPSFCLRLRVPHFYPDCKTANFQGMFSEKGLRLVTVHPATYWAMTLPSFQFRLRANRRMPRKEIKNLAARSIYVRSRFSFLADVVEVYLVGCPYFVPHDMV